MALTLNSELTGSAPDEKANAADDSSYRISAEPVMDDFAPDEARIELSTLPRSYGTHLLCLMARDPHTLLAYWDIDWMTAFGEPAPRERKVHLRILNGDGTEETSREVEPLSGSCLLELSTAGASYTAELGYFSLGDWKSIARSAEALTPPASGAAADTDLATIPFHLSFQRILDVLRMPKQESRSLTAMLADLRDRAAFEAASGLNADQRELIAAIEEAAAAELPRSSQTAIPLWSEERIERLLGFAPSSAADGFGGSSRI